MASRNIIEKIWESHIVPLPIAAQGHPHLFAIDFMLLHEVTSAQAFAMLRERGLKIFDRSALLATLDHSIPTRKNRLEIYDEAARNQVATLRENCKAFEVPLFDFGSGNQGIVHVIGPELGITQPGLTIVCGDSHTSTHGAFGALAFGVGTSEVGHVLASGCILQKEPKSMLVKFEGRLPKGVYAKDAIMKLIATIGIGGATGHIIEYAGEAVSAMSMEERMTVCNMSIECGARAGLIAPDEITFEYIKGRTCAPSGTRWDRAVEHWRSLRSDEGATYDEIVTINLSALRPMVTWGTNPGQAVELGEAVPGINGAGPADRQGIEKALQYVGLEEGSFIEGTPVEWAFIGSCTNGRIEDLRIAASILKNRKVSSSVTMYVVPGSEAVREQAIQEGLDKVFESAGAQFRMPGCSMCLGMNDDLVPEGKRCISSSNRNFVGRQGPGSITHLASPATVAASAIEGRIASPLKFI
ncbi:MAG: 3-isopropylmalate dehydratase large subunit [Deltaproteobacteria bacterium]|nr:3-isopropylmalate dehydratase large subunit [Deltaproteobacteria bacterium]